MEQTVDGKIIFESVEEIRLFVSHTLMDNVADDVKLRIILKGIVSQRGVPLVLEILNEIATGNYDAGPPKEGKDGEPDDKPDEKGGRSVSGTAMSVHAPQNDYSDDMYG